ncbi:MAG TPA: tRNA (adenosine(37)-N6)-threonylcarbamoyltransferase complex dimerization subunit type 1 TsaB [Rhizomicrobium sp.]|nr:tRNA (adenosine(37)-N6)-threonylcarbamoyltransferase complex dimerization subunit type 1 TsaB [Rhizomicrobium sp.]
MKLLAIDTALGACSAAVLDGAAVLSRRYEPMERGHAERIAPMVQEVMQEAGLAFGSLDRLAVTVGPGTFTGQRVGLAFMRGLHLALRRPLIGVTSLRAMAEAALVQTGASRAAVMHDARRGEAYATFVVNRCVVVPVQIATFADAVRAILDAAPSLEEPVAFAGTAGRQAAQFCHAQGMCALETDISTPDALWVGRLAAAEPEPDCIPRPLYLRPPDARLPAGIN